MNTPTSQRLPVRPLLIWLGGIELMILVMIVIGGVTRLTDSGLSITEWKPLLGAIPPLSPEGWQEAFAKYQAFDQFKIRRADMDLAEFKFIYFWEYLHRLWGRLIGFAVALPTLWWWVRGQLDRKRKGQLVGALILGGAQGGIGWFMVVSGLDDGKTYVDHVRLALHLTAAFAIFCYIAWIMLGLRPPPTSHAGPGQRRLRAATLGVLALLTVQIVYGALVAGLKAGMLYSDFPRMGGQWIPGGMGLLQPFAANLIDNPGTVHFIHRVLGLLMVGAVWGLWVAGRRLALTDRPRMFLNLAAGLVGAQFLLGVFTVLTRVNLLVAVTHQVTASLLLVSLFALQYRLRQPKSG